MLLYNCDINLFSRYGEFSHSITVNGPIDFNADLAKPVFKRFSSEWYNITKFLLLTNLRSNIFNKELKELLESYLDRNLLNLIKKFTEAFNRSIEDLGVPKSKTDRNFQYSLHNQQSKIKVAKQSLLRTIQQCMQVKLII